MFQFLMDALQNSQLLAMMFAAVAAIATVLTLAMPLVASDPLERRMKSVALEREKLRQRERERLAQGDKITLRASPRQYMQTVVNRFNLNKWLGQEEARDKLIQAGYRGHAPYVTFLFFRLVSPAITVSLAAFYVFVVGKLDKPLAIKIGILLIAAYVGMQIPYILLKNKIQKRQISIKRAFPDALDLLLICVESGMSIEAAFKRVSEEIGTQSVPLAEEFTSPRLSCPICRSAGRPTRTWPSAPTWTA